MASATLVRPSRLAYIDTMSTHRELYITQRVADVCGGTVSAEDGQWPDAWLTREGERIPVEVVTAMERPYDERPSDGSAVLREQRLAEHEAMREKAKDGNPRAFGAHAVGARRAERFVTTLTGAPGERLPLPKNPADPVRWILSAINQKIRKQYGDAAATILVVDYEWLAPEDYELRQVGDALRHSGCPFREVWVISELASRCANRVRQLVFR
jgi:hypothetical protein